MLLKCRNNSPVVIHLKIVFTLHDHCGIDKQIQIRLMISMLYTTVLT